MLNKTNLGRGVIAAFLVCCFASQSLAQRKQIRVAAAADLQSAMPEIAKAFETVTGTRVDVVYGSSGNFFALIRNGAPLDVFFSADTEYPKKLEESGLAEPESAVIYAFGAIVLWMPANAKCNPEHDHWKCLLDSSVGKIAIANPAHAPYGRAAVEALQKAGIYEHIRAKLVFGENISQAAQFLQSGNAQAGILAHSLTHATPALSGGRQWEIPADFCPLIAQSVVVLKAAKDESAAQAFVKFVTQGAGRDVLAKFGFQPPAR